MTQPQRGTAGWGATAIGLLVLAGCSSSSTITVAQPGVAVDDGPAVPFPECGTDELAFAGRTSLAALGLGGIAGGPEANRIGQIWVTAGPVAFPGGFPAGAQPPPPARMVCVEFDDGSGMSATIDDEWQPPDSAAAPAADASLPVPAIVIAAALALLVGVSYLAFRRDSA